MDSILSKEFVPLYQTIIWVLGIVALLVFFRKEISAIRKILFERLESGAQVKIGPIEIGQLKEKVAEIKHDLDVTNDKVSNLFLTTMSPYMYANLRKIGSGRFGKYAMSKGLKRELYHLRDIGYISVESITSIPKEGSDLSNYVSVTETGQKFINLREQTEKSKAQQGE